MKRSKSSRILKILSYVLLITGMIVILYPFYLTIITALKTPQESSQSFFSFPQSFYLGNFVNVLQKANYFVFFRNSAVVTLVSVFLIMVLIPMCSYAIARNMEKRYYKTIDSMTYGSMGAGILSGKIRSMPSFEKNDLRLNFYDVYKEPKFSKIMELLKVMDSIADGHNVPVGQVALNWSTQKEYVGTALVGVRSIEHADENCKTFDWKLTEEEMKILDSKIEECAL